MHYQELLGQLHAQVVIKHPLSLHVMQAWSFALAGYDEVVCAMKVVSFAELWCGGVCDGGVEFWSFLIKWCVRWRC